MFLAFFIIHIHIIVLLIRNALHNKQANKSNVYPHHQIESNCFFVRLKWIFLFSTKMMMMVDSGHSVSVWLTDKETCFLNFLSILKLLLYFLVCLVRFIEFILHYCFQKSIVSLFILFDLMIELNCVWWMNFCFQLFISNINDVCLMMVPSIHPSILNFFFFKSWINVLEVVIWFVEKLNEFVWFVVVWIHSAIAPAAIF